MRTVEQYKEEIKQEIAAAGSEGISSVDLDIILVRRNYPDLQNKRTALFELVCDYEVLRSSKGILTLPDEKDTQTQ